MIKNIFSILRNSSSNDNPSDRGRSLYSSIGFMISHHLWAQILIGMIFGVALGILLSPSGGALIGEENAYLAGSWIVLPGILFLSLIQMIIIPLVICSIILGITTSGSTEFLKKMGLRIVPYFIMTTAISISIGIIYVNTIKPGNYIDQSLVSEVMNSADSGLLIASKTFEDLTIPQRISNLIPTNLSQAMLEKNLLQIVVFSIIIGIVILTIPKSTAKPVLDLCIAGQVITMKIISWIMLLAPYAVFGLLCDITIKLGLNALTGIGYYFITVLLGLLTMGVVYMILVSVIGGRSPLAFLKQISAVQLLAFSTSSSAAVMPLSIKASEENLNIRPEISRFVVPLGATINMDGTALYQAVAALFLCQVFGIELTFGETILLLITTVGASIGTPATPGVGIVVLATILAGIGVPGAGIGLILGVDRILDMCRTTVNVTGDLTATVIMQKLLPQADDEALEIKETDEEQEIIS
jgi:Na+/H+-dicarboxylate symporter